jgi:hypothetical protein
MTAYDPAIAARLATELLEDDKRALPAPWKPCEAQPDAKCGCGLIWSIPADRTVGTVHVRPNEEDYDGRPEDALAIARLRNNARAAGEQLRAACEEAEALRTESDQRLGAVSRELGMWMFAARQTGAIDEVRSGRKTTPDDVLRLVATLRKWLDERNALCAEVERMRPVFEAAKAWRAERLAADAASADLNERLKRGEFVSIPITNVSTPDGHVVSLVLSPEDKLAKIVDATLANQGTP